MKWAHFLHMYQPYDQHPGVLEKIVNESYRPLIRGFLKHNKTKVTININAVLTELLFKHGYRDVLADIKLLVEMGRVELTGSSKYHSFLPLLPESEVERQIYLNHETNTRYFGEKYYHPIGFFPPEMGYSLKVLNAAKKAGYKYILADQTAILQEAEIAFNKEVYTVGDTNMHIFFREKLPSNLIMAALVRSSESLIKALSKRFSASGDFYIITAMDAETFGHHRPGLEELLFDVMTNYEFSNVTVKELFSYFPKVSQVTPTESSWASSLRDVKEKNPFNLWYDEDNKIHKLEWELVEIAIKSVRNSKFNDESFPQLVSEYKTFDEMSEEEKALNYKKTNWIKSRDMLDKSINSDTMWWSSAKPWWSVEMIEKGIFSLLQVIRQVPDSSDKDLERAEELYKIILFTAHEWQRKGIVDVMALNDNEERRIPLSKRFGASAYYKAILEALAKQELRSLKNREYEQAIRWRDAQYKLERDLDIYDAVHIIDQFRDSGDFDSFDRILKKYLKKYKLINKGQPQV